MSGYEGSHGPYAYERATTTPLQEQYPAFAQPSQTSHYSIGQAVPFDYTTNAYHAAIPGSPSYAARDAYYLDQAASSFDLHAPDLPQVTAYRPTSGMQGTELRIYIRSMYELAAAPQLYFPIMIGAKRCDTAFAKLQSSGPYLEYVVSTDIPSFESTTGNDSQVPLLLQMEDEFGQSLGVVRVGDFTYTEPFHYQTQAPLSEIPRKRKALDESASFIQSPAKRPAQQYFRDPARVEHHEYSYAYQPASERSQYFQPNPYAPHGLPNPYGERRSPNAYQQQLSQPLPYHYTHPLAHQRSSAQSHMAQASERSSHLSASNAIRPTSRRQLRNTSEGQTTSSGPPATPTLIRTSILHSSPSLRAQMPAQSQSFNPYALYQQKATLQIDGNLDAMTNNWTRDEWAAKRRLVEFRRSQSESTITTTFKAIAPNERLPNSICISCILWEDRREYYVTSVDTIHLLESLVAVRFTVEEKNRIRRNLEGFRPQTVSKGKADCEEFFRLIMGFPNPKPRNIEKDVKVFPWKILGHALKKIIGKYSASYSSTASALHPPENGTRGASGTPERTPDNRLRPSPRSASTIPPPNITTSVRSPGDTKLSAGVSPSTSITSHRVPVSAPAYDYWQPHMQPARHHPSVTSAAGRGSWDLGSYVEGSPVAATPQNVHGLPFQPGFLFETQQGSQQDSPPGSSQRIAQRTSSA